MLRLGRLRQRLAQAFYKECTPDLGFISAALGRALENRLAAEDSRDKRAIVIGRSTDLARLLGLRNTRLLHLEHPEFTLENLALLSDEYDFVIADRALHLCGSLDDAAHETLRVLRPGGRFVLTTSILDQTVGLPVDRRRFAPSGLQRLFSAADSVAAGGSMNWAASWVLGQRSQMASNLIPSVATRRRTRRFFPAPRKPGEVRLGVVAVARNEAPYLLEWIAHYRVLGFEHITIYDNESNDASALILRRLAKAGAIDAIYWRNRRKQHKQQSAYNHARLNLRDCLEWCLIVDLDELLVLQDGMTVAGLIPDDPSVSAIAIPWRIFGSGGRRNRETGLTIERFTAAHGQNDRAFKSLVRLRDVERMHTHWPTLARGKLVDCLGNDIDMDKPAVEPADSPARLNHYFSRSWEEFECKRARGRGAGPKGHMRPQSIFFDMDRNEITLTDAMKMAPAVAEEVARLRKIVRG